MTLTGSLSGSISGKFEGRGVQINNLPSLFLVAAKDSTRIAEALNALNAWQTLCKERSRLAEKFQGSCEAAATSDLKAVLENDRIPNLTQTAAF